MKIDQTGMKQIAGRCVDVVLGVFLIGMLVMIWHSSRTGADSMKGSRVAVKSKKAKRAVSSSIGALMPLAGTVTITPALSPNLGPAGHHVEFRKGPAGFISGPGTHVSSGDALFGLPLTDTNVIAAASDNGVSVINYVDSGGGNLFANPRDVGIPPLASVKMTGSAGAPNSGTFNPSAEDDEFAMKSAGYLFIPQAGTWTFTVRSDDGFRLNMGDNNATVAIFDGARTPSNTVGQAAVPSPGYYHYQLVWIQCNNGAMAEFFAHGPGQPTDELVGDTVNGGLQVFQAPFQTVTPACGMGILPGHQVEFRKGQAGFISGTGTHISSGDALFALPLSGSGVLADATDNGAAVINYVDSGGGNLFANPRDVGIPPLAAVKTTGVAGGPNSGTFNPFAEDDEFAMKSTGFLFIPQAGAWNFTVRSDDGFRLTLGSNNTIVAIFDGARTPGNTTGQADVASPGYYPYELVWIQGNSGAMAEFFANGPGQPTDALVGDTANGGLQAFQTLQMFTCPANQTKNNDLDQCGAVVTYPAPTASTGCGTVNCSPASGSFFPVGTTTVTCTTAAGPSCTFTVTVNDTQAPTITCQASINTASTASCPIAVASAPVTFTVTASDNCPGVTFVCKNQNNQVVTSGQPFPVGTTTVTCTATDASGKTATCSFTINAFSFCLQDDSNPGNVVLVNAQTGDFSFCCGGVPISSGRGTLTTRGCNGSIDATKGDRQVHIQWDTAANNGLGEGTAYVQKLSNKFICQITDRNMSNNTCQCTNPPPVGPRKPPKERTL
jgi:hypothetical protein